MVRGRKAQVPMTEIAELLDVLHLDPNGDGTFRARSIDLTGGSVVFGGQLLAQSIVAGAGVDPAKEVKSIHIVFARGALLDAPLEVEVDAMSGGRAFSSAAVTFRQGGKICTRALVLLSAPVDVVRDARGAPHIYASNQNDAAFALGYIHASERMFQMDVFRRIPSGTVSELLGFPDFQTGPDILHAQDPPVPFDPAVHEATKAP